MKKQNTKIKSKNLIVKEKPQSNPLLTDKKQHRLKIAALGASAGGLQAFELFFKNLRIEEDMAYVVISHLDSTHVSMLPELIASYAALPVSVITNGLRVQNKHIYVIPPNKNIVIKHGILYLLEQEKPHYSNLPINFFLQSLAEERTEDAIVVILSGAGTDGSLGLKAIKREGGLTFVQDPLTTEHDGMPKSAISTGLVDFILPPEKIPEQISKCLHFGIVKNGKASEDLQQIFLMLKARTGHDFSAYKLNTICRRIERQMNTHHTSSVGSYARFLRTHPTEIDLLFKDLLIGVTNFFRDPDAFESLKNDVLIKLFKSKPDDYCFRVWVPGCSTGEEVYSIAIILRECLEETKRYFNIQIFGTDIDLSALEIARSGIYPETIMNDVIQSRYKRFFIKENNKIRVKKEIREMVVFGSQNIIKDPPFTKLDLICCRNLLIYLSQDLQKKLLPIFHYSLKPKGILFLGTSEAIAGYVDLFKMVTKKWKIFERKDADNYTHAVFNFPSISRITELAAVPSSFKNLMEGKNDITNVIRRFLLINYVPPCFVINRLGDILYTHGKVPSYIQFPSIENEFNLFKILPKDIKLKIKNTVKQSLNTNKEMLNKHLTVKRKGSTALLINVRVKPLVDIESISGVVCVIFENIISNKSAKLTQTKYQSITKMSKKIIELEQELQYTKESLQTTIEELQSSNEELQSSNEELQSTNEEIETSKEELQSLNEELVIINTELQTRIDQLASVNDDMNNLFNSTEISAIFLDNDLKIKRFTPKAQDLIHLIQNDIGRPIRHFATNIKYEKLIDDIEEVLKSLIPKSFEVLSKDGHWYFDPYSALSNVKQCHRWQCDYIYGY